MRATRINNSTPATASPARAGYFALAPRQAWKAYPVQNGGLAISMLGPSKVRGCPQQNWTIRPKPRGGSNSGSASAAQPESGAHRDSSPASALTANSPRCQHQYANSAVTILLLLPPNATAHLPGPL